MAQLNHARQTDEPTVGALVDQLSEQTSRLVRDEIRLATAELQQKGKAAGIGAGLFSGAALFGYLGLATLIACAILALALVVPAWLSALIVAVVLFVVAGIAALMGRKKVQQATPAQPTRAMDSVKRDVEEVSSAGKGNRR